MSAERIAIVGAGPAGIRAAEALVAAGLHPIVLDEGMRAGGQIYRRPPEGFTRSPAELYGPEAAKAAALHGLFDRLVTEGRITHHPATSVIAVRTAFCTRSARMVRARLPMTGSSSRPAHPIAFCPFRAGRMRGSTRSARRRSR